VRGEREAVMGHGIFEQGVLDWSASRGRGEHNRREFHTPLIFGCMKVDRIVYWPC
jgi:hypothetical protein